MKRFYSNAGRICQCTQETIFTLYVTGMYTNSTARLSHNNTLTEIPGEKIVCWFPYLNPQPCHLCLFALTLPWILGLASHRLITLPFLVATTPNPLLKSPATFPRACTSNRIGVQLLHNCRPCATRTTYASK